MSTELKDAEAAIDRLVIEQNYCRRQAEMMRSIVATQRAALAECERQHKSAEERFDQISSDLRKWNERKLELQEPAQWE